MRVLVVGSGGREHAICYSLNKSKKVNKIFCLPSNDGISTVAEKVDIKINDIPSIVKFAKNNNIDLVFVGSEEPLTLGLVDELEKVGVNVFGCNKLAAEIEGSKQFMKNFCQKYSIPTAKYKNFNSNQFDEAVNFAKTFSGKIVLKTDGLAAGKGVVISDNIDEFTLELKEFFDGKFGNAGKSIIVEEFLDGREVSLFAVSNGNKAIYISSAGDYKQVFDGNKGLNTGGMGTYSPSNLLSDEQINFAKEVFFDKFVNGMNSEERVYKGIIFAGGILTKDGLKLLEYNCRFGDPETQSILPRLENDIIDIIDFGNGKREDLEVRMSQNVCINVVITAKGYPQKYKKDFVVLKNDDIFKDSEKNDFIVFSSGLKNCGNGEFLANGGRLLSICVVKRTYKEARNECYKIINKYFSENKDLHYRLDIASSI